MRLAEITPVATPRTPEQLRIDSLKAAKDRASQSLEAERKRQQVTKAQQKLNAVKNVQAIKPQ